MKKIINLLIVLTFCLAIIVPISVLADTQITQNGNNIANTAVVFNVEPSYTVTIPLTVELEGEYGKAFSKRSAITVKDVFLENSKKYVNVKLSSDFTLASQSNPDITLKYKVYKGSDSSGSEIANSNSVGTFYTEKGEQTQDIFFMTTSVPKYAGNYSDTVVFNISVEGDD